MALSLAINATETEKAITQVVEAMFGVQPGNTILESLSVSAEATSLAAVANSLVDFVDASKKATAEDLANEVVANLGFTTAAGLTEQAVTDAQSFVAGQLNAVDAANWGSAILDVAVLVSQATADPIYGSAVTAYNSAVISSLDYSLDPNNTDINAGGGATNNFDLTVGQDNLIGTADSDTFIARIFDNQNTAQSGDVINGGGGEDSLFIDVGNSQNFAITLETNSVENFAVRAEARAEGNDTNDNNLTDAVQIDAERMKGTDRYESNNSRADVIVEDVRIERKVAYGDATDQITENITVAMVSTDPGNVDLGVYFDQHSLVNQGDISSNAVTFTVGNQIEQADFDPAKPLIDIPYTNVSFKVSGQDIILTLDLTGVETYDQMFTAFELGFNNEKAINPLLDGVELTRSINTDTFFSRDGVLRTADEYLLTIDNGEITPAEIGWFANGGLPSNNAFSARVEQGDVTVTSNLITSTIILDDVGRGSMGGDLIVGGLSIGNTGDDITPGSNGDTSTSNSKGVEQFNITVERNSQLQEIQSTNNTLKEVFLVNGNTNGNLIVAGDTNGDNDLPGIEGNAGFTDVRIIDASAMKGSVNIDAELTDAVVGKYMNRGDVAADVSSDNAEFIYTLGTNNDALALQISKANLEASGTTNREDFNLDISGGAGNDVINTIIGDGVGVDGDNWYINSSLNANLTVNGNDGDDTIITSGAGNFKINAGNGNDTVYTDDTGGKATWVYNAANTTVDDLQGEALVDTVLYKSQLTVTFSAARSLTNSVTSLTSAAAAALNNGFESTVTIPTVDFIGNQANLNQAIKDAINNDLVLSKLLVAADGPANTLVIDSLVDGEFSLSDLEISVTGANTASLSAAELTGMNGAYQDLINNSTAASLVDADLDGFVAATLALGGLAQGTDLGGGLIVGSESTQASDNTINLGSGDDVLVLSTSAAANDVVVFSGSDIGNNTIVNFENVASGWTDALDFSAYLTGLETLPAGSTSVLSQSDIANVTILSSFNGTENVDADEILIFNDFAQNAVANETWANLTGADLLAAIQNSNVAGARDYGNISVNDMNVADANANLVGTTIKNVVLIENDLNDGEYKVFDVTSTGGTVDEFTSAVLLGTIDLGDTLGLPGVAVPPVVVPPVVPPVGGTANTAIDATTGNVVDGGAAIATAYTIAAGTYTSEIAGFGAGDTLAFFAGAAISVVPDADNTDGIQSITAADAGTGATTTITLTGLSAADDAALFNLASIDTVFGAGTIV